MRDFNLKISDSLYDILEQMSEDTGISINTLIQILICSELNIYAY